MGVKNETITRQGTTVKAEIHATPHACVVLGIYEVLFLTILTLAATSGFIYQQGYTHLHTQPL